MSPWVFGLTGIASMLLVFILGHRRHPLYGLMFGFLAYLVFVIVCFVLYSLQ